MISILRIVGLIVGIIGFILAFKVYRGPKWNRFNFLLFGIISFSFILISIKPDILNFLTSMLSLEQEQRGRVLTLLIFSNIILWFAFLNFKTRLDEYNHKFDIFVRSFSQKALIKIKKKLEEADIMIIVAAYNEAENLKVLLKKIPREIKGRKVEVLVIDDGSTDDTFRVVEEEGNIAIRNIINRGQGAALRLGYDALLSTENIKIGVTMDADNQHSPEDIENLVEPILKDEHDIVIGSRAIGSREKVSFLRDLGNAFFPIIINFLTGLKLTDCSSSFKAFNTDKIRLLNLREDQYQVPEVIIEAAKKGLRMGEVPINAPKRIYGYSKKGKDLRYGLNFTKAIIKSWWR